MPPSYELSHSSDAPPRTDAPSNTGKRFRDDSSEDELLPNTGRKRKSQHHRSPDAKLRSVLATLSDLDLSLYDLLSEAKKVSEASTEGESQWASFLEDIAEDDRCQLQPHFRRVTTHGLGAQEERLQECNRDSAWEAKAKQVLRHEVQAVGKSQIFGKWVDEDPTNFFATGLPHAIAAIGQHAPHLTEILRVISLPLRDAPLEAKQGSLVSFFSILCHAQQPQMCSNIPTQMSLYLHTNGVNKSVIQTLHKMGVCVNWDVSMLAVKELSAKRRFSGHFNGISPVPPVQPPANGNPAYPSVVTQQTDKPVRGRGRPRKDHTKVLPGAHQPEPPTSHSPPAERARLDQQLGVQNASPMPPNLNFGFKRPQWKVTQPPKLNAQTNGGMPRMEGPVGSCLDEPAAPTDSGMRSVGWPSKDSNEGSPPFRSATLSNAAMNKGYGLLVPPHKSTPANHHNKGGTIIFRANRQRSNVAAQPPLPPLPPALTNPALPPSASPQEKLQYAMIAHNHSRLNQGQG